MNNIELQKRIVFNGQSGVVPPSTSPPVKTHWDHLDAVQQDSLDKLVISAAKLSGRISTPGWYSVSSEVR